MVAALAPARFRYCPSTLLAPSWVISENKLTIPISTMNAMAPVIRFFFISITACNCTIIKEKRLYARRGTHIDLRVTDSFDTYTIPAKEKEKKKTEHFAHTMVHTVKKDGILSVYLVKNAVNAAFSGWCKPRGILISAPSVILMYSVPNEATKYSFII